MKALHELDGRAVADLIREANPVPDDTDILISTLQCLNLAYMPFASPVSTAKR